MEKMKNISGWLYSYWPCALPFLAAYSLMFIFLFVYPLTLPVFLIWLCIPVYFIHEFEEYVYPGGFDDYTNRLLQRHSGLDDDECVLTPRAAYWINVGIIWFLFPSSAVLSTLYGPGFGVWVAWLTVVNGVLHIFRAVQSREYNPGLAASIVLNLPVGIAAVIVLAGVVPLWIVLLSLLFAVFLMAVMIVYFVARIRHLEKIGNGDLP